MSRKTHFRRSFQVNYSVIILAYVSRTMDISRSGLYLFCERPFVAAVKFYFYKINKGSFYSIQSPFSEINLIQGIKEFNKYYDANLSEIRWIAFYDYNLSSIYDEIKADNEEFIFISYLNSDMLIKLGSTYQDIFRELNLLSVILKKKIVINYLLPYNFESRRSKKPSVSYLKRQGVDLNLFTAAYWFYNESHYDMDTECDILEVFDLKTGECFVY